MSNEEIENTSRELSLEKNAINTKDLNDKIESRIKSQKELLKSAPFVQVVDSASHTEAKKNRTSLRTARTDLQKERKAIISKLNYFKKDVDSAYGEIISITSGAEEKQQEEVKAYEDKKQKEKEEKERIERERLEAIRTGIKDFFKSLSEKITGATFETIEALQAECFEALDNYDKCSTEVHLTYFIESESELRTACEVRSNQLKEIEADRIEKERLKKEAEEAKAKAERQRIAAEKLAAEIEKKQAEEAAKLKEKEEENERIKAELKAFQEKAKAEKEKAEAEIKAEREKREKIEAEEKARKEKEAAAEAERMAKIEAEKKAKAEAEQKEKDRIAAEKAEAKRKKAEAARLEALKPDMEKATGHIIAITAKAISDTEMPEIKDETIKQILESIPERLEQMRKDILKELEEVK